MLMQKGVTQKEKRTQASEPGIRKRGGTGLCVGGDLRVRPNIRQPGQPRSEFPYAPYIPTAVQNAKLTTMMVVAIPIVGPKASTLLPL